MDNVPNGSMQRFCSSCGRMLRHPDDNFCIYCGAKTDSNAVSGVQACEKKESKFVCILKAVAYVALFLLVQTAVSAGAMTLMTVSFVGNNHRYPTQSELISMVGQNSWLIGALETLVLVFLLWLFFFARKKKLSHEICLKPMKPSAFGISAVSGVGAQFSVVLFLTVLYTLFPFLSNFSVSSDLEDLMGASLVLNFFYIAVLTPIMEELIFRGLVYTRLRRAMSVKGAIIVSALIFGMAHMNFEQFIYTFPMGILMAAVFEKYDSILASFAIHMAFNGGNLLAGYIPDEPEALGYAAVFMGAGIFLITLAFIFGSEKEDICNTPPLKRKGTFSL